VAGLTLPPADRPIAEERQLAGFIDRYGPQVACTTRAALAAMRKRLPGATEFVYDKTRMLVIGFGPTERPSDAVFSLIVYPRWVSLCFLSGASLADPDRILQGSGHIVRHVRLDADATVLSTAPVQRLIDAALADADPPWKPRGTGRILIRPVSKGRRSR
jgi:hypothetical protein